MQGSNDGSYIEDSHDDDIFRVVMMDHICSAVMMDHICRAVMMDHT